MPTGANTGAGEVEPEALSTLGIGARSRKYARTPLHPLPCLRRYANRSIYADAPLYADRSHVNAPIHR